MATVKEMETLRRKIPQTPHDHDLHVLSPPFSHKASRVGLLKMLEPRLRCGMKAVVHSRAEEAN